MTHFRLQDAKDAPQWIKDIVKIAGIKARNYSWQDVRSVTVSHKESTFFVLPWSVELDDLISEGCLAYLEAIERGKSEGWARERARGAISEAARNEARAHGYTRDKTGKMCLRPVSIHKNFLPGLRGGGLANSKKTHCPQGHEYSTILKRSDGGIKRVCRPCELERNKRYNKTRKKRGDTAQGSALINLKTAGSGLD